MEGKGRVLVGLKEICTYVERGKGTIRKWTREENFPAVVIDGRWESNTALIDTWRTRRIERLCGCAAEGKVGA